MTKVDLEAKWGKYCDTNKLVDDTMALLTKYHHRNTEHGVCKMLDTYFTNKSDLIEMFKKSEHYVGDMRIVIDVELDRDIDANETYTFCTRFCDKVGAKDIFIKYVDEDGKQLKDYLKTGISGFKATDLYEESVRNALSQLSANRDKFNMNGETKESRLAFNKFYYFINKFGEHPRSTLGANMISYVKENRIDVSLAEGMKTSRAFNKVCTHYGVNNLPEYNKLFAQYADMVSDLKRKLKFFISLNPLDYLTMSFGRSWASCHTIDQRNERHMPNDYSGAYCGGTVSYMLDKTSIITYVYDHIPTDVEEGKIYRNMFHYSNGMLIQGRIYPQGNDGATDLYQTFRTFVHKEISDMLGVSNVWVKKNNMNYTYRTCGCHYKDYANFSSCNATYLKAVDDATDVVIDIGHDRVCPDCGKTINGTAPNRLTHSTCPSANTSHTTTLEASFDWFF